MNDQVRKKKHPTSFLGCMWNSLLKETEVRLKTHDITASIFSSHNGLKLEFSKKRTGKVTNTWPLNNTTEQAM